MTRGAAGLVCGTAVTLLAFAVAGAGHGVSLPFLAVTFPVIFLGSAALILAPLYWCALAVLCGLRRRGARIAFVAGALLQLGWLRWLPAQLEEVRTIGAGGLATLGALYLSGHALLWLRFLRDGGPGEPPATGPGR